MSLEDTLNSARSDLEAARRQVQDELRAYPTPITGCDAQYNYLIGMRGAIEDALQALRAPHFVATPRTPEPNAGVESR